MLRWNRITVLLPRWASASFKPAGENRRRDRADGPQAPQGRGPADDSVRLPGAVLARPEPRCAIAVSCDQLREQIDEAARRCSHAE